MADGIIIMDKPAGWTSMDVCAKLRGILHTRIRYRKYQQEPPVIAESQSLGIEEEVLKDKKNYISYRKGNTALCEAPEKPYIAYIAEHHTDEAYGEKPAPEVKMEHFNERVNDEH